MLTFGSDPEYFIVNKLEEAIPVPHFIFDLGINPVYWNKEHDRDKYHPVMIKEDDFHIMMDGVAFEFTLKPVKTSKELFKENGNALLALKDFAERFGFRLHAKPIVNYYFYDWHDENNFLKEHCGIFGCDPDKDAIKENYQCPVNDVRKHKIRYGGGHFHISDLEGLFEKYPKPAIKFLAILCGTTAIKNSPYPEMEKERAKIYGQPGRYRLQSYPNGNTGIEYRSPSNSWLLKEEAIDEMFERAKLAYHFLRNFRTDILENYLEKAVEAIENADQPLAEEILFNVERSK